MNRLVRTWGDRLYPKGDVTVAAQAFYNYTTDFANGTSCAQTGSNYVANWELLGPKDTPAGVGNARGMGQIHRLAFHPQYGINGNKTIFAGSAFGGLFVTTDNGANWSNFGTDTQLPIASISGIAIHPNNPAQMLISTGDADGGIIFDQGIANATAGTQLGYNPIMTAGVYRTTQADPHNPGSVQWENINGNVSGMGIPAGATLLDIFKGGGTIQQLMLHPTNANQAFIASSKGVFRSNNVWAANPSWELILSETPVSSTANDQFRGFAFKPGSPQTIYASGRHLYRSLDGGNTWETLTLGNFYVVPTDPNQIILGYTHVKKITIGTTPIETLLSPYSGDGFHADVHDLVFQPDSAYLWCGNDGGVSRKDYINNNNGDGGWSYKHKGLAVSKSWSMDDYERDPKVIGIANQDADCNFTNDKGDTWYASDYGGDGYGLQIDNITGKIYHNNNYETRVRNLSNLTAGWGTSSSFSAPQTPPENFIMLNHPQTEVQYWGFRDLFSRSSSGTWNREVETKSPHPESDSSNPSKWPTIARMAISPSSPNIWYYTHISVYQSVNPTDEGYRKPRFYRWDGDSITNLTLHLPTFIHPDDGNPYAMPITGIAIDPSDANRLWITFSGYQAELKVWHSADGGQTWTNADPNQTLCNLPVTGIVYQPGTNDRLYIGTDVGVFVRNTTTGDWEKYGNIPNVRVTQLKLNSCIGKLRAATFGRGVWEADLLPRQLYSKEMTLTGSHTWNEEHAPKPVLFWQKCPMLFWKANYCKDYRTHCLTHLFMPTI